MQRKAVSLLGFIIVVAASFYLGTYVNMPTGSTNDAFDEVMQEITDNHYTQPDEEELWQGAIEGMLESLNDPFSSYFDRDEYDSYQSNFGETYIGVGITVVYQDSIIIVEEVRASGPADGAGIRPNDIIAEVDGVNIQALSFYEAINQIIGEENTEVTIGVIRQGVEELIPLTMTRVLITNSSVTSKLYTEGDKTIGYIEVTTFGDETADLFDTAVATLEESELDGMIIDLRNNGGGHLATVVSMLQQFLVDNGSEMFSIEYYNDGVFKREEFMGVQEAKKTYDIVTLVNENSASASEVFASAMKEQGEYTVVGVTTFGKGTMQIDINLSSIEDDLIHLTIGKWITADGNWVHYDGGTDGVVPNIEVEPTKYETAYKMFLFDEETLVFDTVDYRIKNLQIILNSLEYTVREDGYFDQATKDAVMDFQSLNGLIETGIVDNEFLGFINTHIDTMKADDSFDNQLKTALEYFNE